MSSSYIGMSENDALQQALLRDGVTLARVAFRDGKIVATRTNHRDDRLNLHIETGTVIAAAFG
jgi:leucyl aminopeptidase (aminopeptidase T)